MSTDRVTLEAHLKDYEGQLKGLTSYVRELGEKTAEHGTDAEHFEPDLVEARHNIEYYEGEIARIRELIGEGRGGTSYSVYQDAAGEWRWRLRAANHRVIADSGEGYRDRQDCLRAIALVKGSKDAPVNEGE